MGKPCVELLNGTTERSRANIARAADVLAIRIGRGISNDFSAMPPYAAAYAMTETIERIVLASRPVGEPTIDNFRSEKLPIPHPGSNEMLLRTLWLSLDPYMRGRMP
jgi:hypothetical protein